LSKEGGTVFDEVEGVHTEVDAAGTEGRDQILFSGAHEKEAGDV
jgi:hypothetical protein